MDYRSLGPLSTNIGPSNGLGKEAWWRWLWISYGTCPEGSTHLRETVYQMAGWGVYGMFLA